MGYTTDDKKCRVDFFKPSGKWYTTEEFIWLHWSKETLIYDAFILSLRERFKDGERYCYSGMTAVCLEPYHENAYPLMLNCWDTARTMAEKKLAETH